MASFDSWGSPLGGVYGGYFDGSIICWNVGETPAEAMIKCAWIKSMRWPWHYKTIIIRVCQKLKLNMDGGANTSEPTCLQYRQINRNSLTLGCGQNRSQSRKQIINASSFFRYRRRVWQTKSIDAGIGQTQGAWNSTNIGSLLEQVEN